jgi:hypothetical protein
MARVAVMAVVLGASFMDCSALLHPPPQAFSAAPQLRAGASASLLQRVARPDLEVRRACVRACVRVYAASQAQPTQALRPMQTSVFGVQREGAGATALDGVERLRGGAGLAKKLGLKNVGMLMVCVSRPPALDLALPVGLTSTRVQVLLSLLYVPRAMNTCVSRIDPTTRKVIRLGCGTRTSTRTIASCAPACPHTGRHTCLEPHTRTHAQTREYLSRTQSLSLSGSSLTITNLVTLAGLGLVLVNSRQVPSACTHTYVTRGNALST